MGSIGTSEGHFSDNFHTTDQYLAEPRPIKIIVIGAGLSGIAATKIFRERFADRPATLVIYEKNDDVTGTWLENRYPGYKIPQPCQGQEPWTKAELDLKHLG